MINRNAADRKEIQYKYLLFKVMFYVADEEKKEVTIDDHASIFVSLHTIGLYFFRTCKMVEKKKSDYAE